MKVLVTGGAGFIGSHFVRELLARPCYTQVTVVDKLTYAGNRASLPARHPRLAFIRADVCSTQAMMAALPGHDAVVHFAAETHVDRSLSGAPEFSRTNVLGTHVVMDCCARLGVSRVVHVSTDEVYGSLPADADAWTEQSPLDPNSPYAASKAGSDAIALAYWRTHRLPVMVSRCSNNYGSHQFPEKLIPLFVTNMLTGMQCPVYGDGGNVREWLHVADNCRALRLILHDGRPGEVYNIGGGAALTNLDLIAKLLDLCRADASLLRFVPDRKGHDRRYALDDSKIRTELGYAPEVPFDAGLAEVVRWYQDNHSWWAPLRRAELIRQEALR